MKQLLLDSNRARQAAFFQAVFLVRVCSRCGGRRRPFSSRRGLGGCLVLFWRVSVFLFSWPRRYVAEIVECIQDDSSELIVASGTTRQVCGECCAFEVRADRATGMNNAKRRRKRRCKRWEWGEGELKQKRGGDSESGGEISQTLC